MARCRAVKEIPLRGARTLELPNKMEIAIFRTGDGNVHALHNLCPHLYGPLSQGIIHGRNVTCPLHNWVISLDTGEAQGADRGHMPVVPVRVDAGRILISRAAVIRDAG